MVVDYFQAYDARQRPKATWSRCYCYSPIENIPILDEIVVSTSTAAHTAMKTTAIRLLLIGRVPYIYQTKTRN